jgi:histone H3/H4
MHTEVSFQPYIYSVLVERDPESGMSKDAMAIINSLVGIVGARVTTAAIRLAKMSGRTTVQAGDFTAAVPLVFPKGMSKYAEKESEKALLKFQKSFA